VATGCNLECKDPPTDAPRLYEEIVARLQKVAGQHQALLGGDGGAAMFSTNEDAFEVFLASDKGKELVQVVARKARRRRSSEGDSSVFKCWYCEKTGHAKRDCPTLEDDKKTGTVKKCLWRTADFRGKEEDRKTKSGKKKAEEVNVAKQEDSGRM
jgi:hypothetical protein